MSQPGRDRSVVKVQGQVLANRRTGAYHHLTIAAPGVAEVASPGQFAALSVGGPGTGTLLRRSFSIHKVSPTGPDGGTLDLVIAAKGPGTTWLTMLRPQDLVDVVAPLGRGFPLPTERSACVLVGGGYGSAPLFWFADVLRERGCSVSMVLGAATRDRLFGVVEARRTCDEVVVTTDDGSAGERGWVSDVLPSLFSRTEASTVYACGPMGMLQSVTEVAAKHGVVAQVAVEEAMACGVGVCMTCVMPVADGAGVTSMVRSCVEGPVFRGDRIRWDAFNDGVCRVPADAVGTPQAGGH